MVHYSTCTFIMTSVKRLIVECPILWPISVVHIEFCTKGGKTTVKEFWGRGGQGRGAKLLALVTMSTQDV